MSTTLINVEVCFDRELETEVEFPSPVQVDVVLDRAIEIEVECGD